MGSADPICGENAFSTERGFNGQKCNSDERASDTIPERDIIILLPRRNHGYAVDQANASSTCALAILRTPPII
jgi:hypothetical protein